MKGFYRIQMLIRIAFDSQESDYMKEIKEPVHVGSNIRNY